MFWAPAVEPCGIPFHSSELAAGSDPVPVLTLQLPVFAPASLP